MKRSRSLGIVLSAFGVVLLVSSCVIKSSEDDDDGVGGAGTSGAGGSTSGGGSGGSDSGGGTGGGDSGGSGGGDAGSGGGDPGGAGGMSGAAGAAGMSGGGAGGAPTYEECLDCLLERCPNELEDCLDSDVCSNEQGTGQYDFFAECVEAERPFGSINRTLLRECGNQVIEGQVIWPPEGMSPATRDLINCLATGVADVNPDMPNNDWADDEQITQPWAAESCARLACTSQTDS